MPGFYAMTRTKRIKERDGQPPIPVGARSSGTRRAVLGCCIGAGIFLGLMIEGYRHHWFVPTSAATLHDELGPAAINTASAPEPAPAGMVWVPGGTFWMGSDQFPDAKPM